VTGRFDEFIARIAPEAPQRERERRLLTAELAELRDIGFGTWRVPAASGGSPITLQEQFARLIRLSAADASLGHVWRGHLAFVESLRLQPIEQAQPWFERILAGDFVGNAQSERRDTAHLETRIDRSSGEPLLSGTKYYTTGSIYADWIHLAALDGDERVAVTVSAHHPGVRSTDDWDGFGQLLTGSGTTVFDRAPVGEDGILVSPAEGADVRGHHLGAILQLSLLAVIAGIAQRALDDTEDPLVQLVVGELDVVAATTRRLVLSVAADLGAASDRRATAVEMREIQFEVFRLQELVPRLVLDATTRLFEVGGASAVGTGRALDRHWRNVRTIASHNPVIQRTRALGQVALTGTLPEWQAPGAEAPRPAEAALA